MGSYITLFIKKSSHFQV